MATPCHTEDAAPQNLPVGPSALAGGDVAGAIYNRPTMRYPHGVLGDDIEWGGMTVSIVVPDNPPLAYVGPFALQQDIVLPQELVFEDIGPRLWDVTGDGLREVVVVQSHQTRGARLLVYKNVEGRGLVELVATPYIGQRNRWLAPIGAADLDGDGHIEIAYIDRPHLARTLRIWRFKNGELTEVAAASGLTNHRIGEDFISGGIRDCGQGPEMITADANWTNIMATRLVGDQLRARIVGPHEGRRSFEAALSC